MKRNGLYLVLGMIVAGIVSFTKVSDKKGPEITVHQRVQPGAAVASDDIAVESNSNGSTRQITWQESTDAVYVKTFTYAENTVTIIEKKNTKTIKEETAAFSNGLLKSIKGKLLNEDGTQAVAYTMNYQYNDAGQTQRVLYGNGNRHEYVYDNRGNLTETNWYNHQGDIMVAAKKQYFPRLPDAYTVYHSTTGNAYACFIPPFDKQSSLYNKMAGKVKSEISFDGISMYLMDTDGYILK
jgi:YD repeat-containing protein